MTDRVHVVGAAIVHEQRCLVAQRGPGMRLPGKWEFPGGKVEAGEAPEVALAREIAEELGLEIAVGERLGSGTAPAGGRLIVLDVYAARITSGELVLREHAQVVWLTADELPSLDWAEADIPCLKPVQRWLEQGAAKREWYVCGTTIVVFCGAGGGDGVYRFRENTEARWEFCPAGTRLWDWYHQAVFYAHRAEPAQALDYSALPPLPAQWPADPAITLLDEEQRSAHARPGSTVWAAVERAGGELPVFIVLEEDIYETTFGDGCFRDFRTACYEESAARSAAAEISTPNRAAHLRRGWLRLEAAELQLSMAAEDRSVFDHVTLAEVCNALADQGRSRCAE